MLKLVKLLGCDSITIIFAIHYRVMDRLLQNIKIAINDNIYVKDPESSELGRRIIEYSIVLMDEIGFEAFTFRKLGERIGSNESSIYRYFENKHKLLVYLSSWYWGWLEYQLVFATHGVPDAEEKLSRAIEIISRNKVEDQNFGHINEVLLTRIVINESSKSYLTKEVKQENRDGYFVIYKRMVHRLEEMIRNCNPNYLYTTSLASTIMETSLHQHFLKEHLPSLTNGGEDNATTTFIKEMVFSTIKK